MNENIKTTTDKKENDFKINLIFDTEGENLNSIIERAFSNYFISMQS